MSARGGVEGTQGSVLSANETTTIGDGSGTTVSDDTSTAHIGFRWMVRSVTA